MIRFADLKRKRYWYPLMVEFFAFEFFISCISFFSFVLKSIEPRILAVIGMLQIGIGLLMLQQLSGINGVLFYSSNIFERAG